MLLLGNCRSGEESKIVISPIWHRTPADSRDNTGLSSESVCPNILIAPPLPVKTARTEVEGGDGCRVLPVIMIRLASS